MDRSSGFGRQQSHRLCDRVAHVAVWLYSCECVLHLRKRIQSSGMVKDSIAPRKLKERCSMLQPTHIYDEAASYAPGTDSWNAVANEMHNLYLLSLLLTADPHEAQRCFFGGIGESESEIDVFMSWAQARARRTIVEHAIGVVAPIPEHAYDFSSDLLTLSAAKMKNNIFDAILGLNAFERFVYIMSVVEQQSDEDCSTLLGCSQKDVMIARSVALAQLASTYTPDNHPVEASGTRQTVFANHAA